MEQIPLNAVSQADCKQVYITTSRVLNKIPMYYYTNYAVECNGAIYYTVVSSYCPRSKLLLKPSYFEICTACSSDRCSSS